MTSITYEWLKDPENAAAFLNAVIEDSDKEAFLLALRDVAQAQGGMTAIGYAGTRGSVRSGNGRLCDPHCEIGK